MIGFGGAVFIGLIIGIRILPKNDPVSWTHIIIALLIGGTIAIVGGTLWLMGTGDITCILDKARNKMTLNRKGLIAMIQGAGSAECKLRDITDVILEEDWEEERRDKNGTVIMPGYKTFRIALVLKSGKHIPLTLYYGAERQSKAEQAERIRKFLFYTDYKRKIRRLQPK